MIAEDPRRTRAELSRLACQVMHGLKPEGGLKDMSCRVAMLRMQDDRLIQLPPPRCPRPQANILIRVETGPQEPLHLAAHDLPRLQLRQVGERVDSRLWNEYIQLYHSSFDFAQDRLGFKTLAGAQLRYWVYAGGRLAALLGFGAAAWQCQSAANSLAGRMSSAKKIRLLPSTMPGS